jgi:hypothetical protein
MFQLILLNMKISLLEKNEMVENIRKIKRSLREIEEACIWQFICEIMNSLEI